MATTKVKPTHVEIPFEAISAKGHNINPTHVHVSVDGPQPVDATIRSSGSGSGGKPTVAFTTTTTGRYTVTLLHGGAHLRLSPFDVNVTVKDDKGAPQPAPSLPHIPKNHVEFEVDALDEEGVAIPDGAALDISVEGPDDRVQPGIERDGDKIIIAFHTTVSEGAFEVAVKYKGEHIQRSPFSVEITPQQAGKTTFEQHTHDIEKKRQGVTQLEAPQLHREIQFTVPARNRDGSYPNATECNGLVISGEDGEVAVTIGEDVAQPNTFKVQFNALKAGKHKVQITHHAKGELANSPFSINIPPEAFKR